MSITVKYIGLLAVHAKKAEETIEFYGKTLKDLFNVLSEKQDAIFHEELISNSGELKITVLVNSDAATLETVLKDGDHLVFLQSVYGG